MPPSPKVIEVPEFPAGRAAMPSCWEPLYEQQGVSFASRECFQTTNYFPECPNGAICRVCEYVNTMRPSDSPGDSKPGVGHLLVLQRHQLGAVRGVVARIITDQPQSQDIFLFGRFLFILPRRYEKRIWLPSCLQRKIPHYCSGSKAEKEGPDTLPACIPVGGLSPETRFARIGNHRAR
jgi:hypothetical protein